MRRNRTDKTGQTVFLQQSKHIILNYKRGGVEEHVGISGNGGSAVPLPSLVPLGSHGCVGGCGIVTLQCHHDLDVGGAVSV